MSRRGKLEKFFMLGVIPFVFTVVLSVALLIFLGVDVGAEVAKVGQKLPLVGKYFPNPDDRSQQEQRKIEQLTAELHKQNEIIEQLQQDLEAEKEKSAELVSENREREEKEQTEAEKQWVDSYKQVAKTLQDMTASKAAPIVSHMPPQEGLMMIYSMKSDAQAQLLSKLPSDQAAVYTTMLKELLEQSNHMSLAQASSEVTAKYEKTISDWSISRKPADWALMFANMQPEGAAAILEEMNENKALNILRELDIGTRAAILSSLEEGKASRFSEKLVGEG